MEKNFNKRLPLEKINKISESICKVIIKYKEGKKYGTGFFMRYIKDKVYNCLVTNFHVISQNLIDFKNTY